MTTNYSIHPRAWMGGKKCNTSKVASPARRARVIAAIAEHCERHPNDGMSAGRLAKLKSEAA